MAIPIRIDETLTENNTQTSTIKQKTISLHQMHCIKQADDMITATAIKAGAVLLTNNNVLSIAVEIAMNDQNP